MFTIFSSYPSQVGCELEEKEKIFMLAAVDMETTE